VIPEPLGGAHRDPDQAALNVKASILKHLRELQALPAEELLNLRYKNTGTSDTLKRGKEKAR